MAMQKDELTTPWGLSLPKIYYRVVRFKWSRFPRPGNWPNNGPYMEAEIEGWIEKPTEENPTAPILSDYFIFFLYELENIPGDNMIAKIYNYIHTLDKYKDAEAV
jgi:hypothetical protein